MTALQAAVEFGNPDIVQLLLSSEKVDPNIINVIKSFHFNNIS